MDVTATIRAFGDSDRAERNVCPLTCALAKCESIHVEVANDVFQMGRTEKSNTQVDSLIWIMFGHSKESWHRLRLDQRSSRVVSRTSRLCIPFGEVLRVGCFVDQHMRLVFCSTPDHAQELTASFEDIWSRQSLTVLRVKNGTIIRVLPTTHVETPLWPPLLELLGTIVGLVHLA